MQHFNWNIARSRELYNMAHWSDGYFDINAQGRVIARPRAEENTPGIDLHKLGEKLQAAGLTLPILVRFNNILHHRIDLLSGAFQQAMQTENYQAKYTAVYPIKVNQQHCVVDEIVKHGGERVGLEAGSKPELLAVLAMARPGSTIICNGYKDREFIQLALIGKRLGLEICIVVEKRSEVALIIEEARAMNIDPTIGIRVRLASISAGKWQNTGGEKSKFGLSSNQVLEIVDILRQADMLQHLKLMHFHMGSQVANIRDVHAALREAGRYFAQIYALGAPLSTVDVGGGLGIDYEGTHSRNSCSINYTVQEYANNVVHTFAEVCKQMQIPYPNIVTESGRAMTAHHAVLLTNITDFEEAPGLHMPEPAEPHEPRIIQDLWYGLANLGQHSAIEAYHDACYWMSEVYSQFTHGVLELKHRARAEQIYFSTCQGVRNLLSPNSRAHRDMLDELNEKLADKYFINLSLFQSIPDAWAIEQIFPIMPLQRLYERPDRRAVLQDLTCDSDGHIEFYVDSEGIETSLPIHSLNVGQTYMLGVFLVGAYQEILGDMHNLFGDTHAVNVILNEDGSYELSEPEQGDSVEDVLRYVHIEGDLLRQLYQQRINACDDLNSAEQDHYRQALENGLAGYTYLEGY